ncbi:MAG: hypothetical protein Tp1124SUR272871_52 [Prokaryotic dsDNA virus sp.]|nr:MAG: hypothetical protein Tp1125SUR00d2C35834131_42 [Prokaryotic dsDNA virus sp.]QDP67372.1 MAG: hypothetical protein Tp1124SUR272871_52 [Prokaryotic dsDNA virus sp.]|tara:strand:+ start:31498 stop:34110 length:2613 start_codon:yes stop_codon:yes gene_type:complete
MSLLQNSNAISAPADTGFYDYQIANSIRGSASGNSTLKFTAGTPTSTTKMTMSFWVKRHTPDSTDAGANNVFTTGTGGGNYFYIAYNATLTMENTGGNQGVGYLLSEEKYRDPASWYHVILRIDTSQSTQFDRIRVYVNGRQLGTSPSPDWRNQAMITNTAQDESFSYLNADGLVQAWGGLSGKGHGTEGADLSLADCMFFDGQSYYSELGEYKNGVWIPKDPSSLTFGNNGYWLKFTNSSNLGEDFSGNDNDFTVANFASHDQLTDTPTFNDDSNGGNYCTYNPLVPQGGAQKLMTLREGNLLAESETNDKYHQTIGTMGVKTGKWYIEWYIVDDGYPSFAVGWHYGSQLGAFDGSNGTNVANFCHMGYFTGSTVYLTPFGSTDTNPTNPNHSSFTNQGAPATGDVIMCAIDMDAGKGWWGINGVWGDVGSGTGNPATGANAGVTWTASDYPDHKFPFTLAWANPDTEIVMNTGSEGTFCGNLTAGGNADDTGYGNFKYDVPAGFLALCAGNLPLANAINPSETDDNYPQKLFGATIWTGDGTTSRAITGLGFQPDWLWFKSRGSAFSHRLYDTSRGISSTGGKRLFANTNGAETDQTSGQDISAVGTDGFTLGASSNLYTNDTNDGGLHVNFAWRANGGTTSSNSNGSITSTVQVDPSGCFSIVTYTGESATRTVGHGLNTAPYMIIVRSRSSRDWGVYHKDRGLNMFKLNSNSAEDTGASGVWGGSHPTNTVFSIGDASESGKSENYVAYCFANCDWIKAGSYVGNADENGSYVHTGFDVAWLFLRAVNSGDDPQIYDNARSTYNPATRTLATHSSAAETDNSNRSVDFLSNGFKFRTTNSNVNGSDSDGYVYLAIAHNPAKYSTAK